MAYLQAGIIRLLGSTHCRKAGTMKLAVCNMLTKVSRGTGIECFLAYSKGGKYHRIEEHGRKHAQKARAAKSKIVLIKVVLVNDRAEWMYIREIYSDKFVPDRRFQ